jgi:hypothetical protein
MHNKILGYSRIIQITNKQQIHIAEANLFGLKISIQYPSGSLMNARPFILPEEKGES